MSDSLQQKIKDLEFLLRREKMESRKKVKEVLYHILEIYDAQQQLLDIAAQQSWEDVVKKFVTRFSVVSKIMLQSLQRSGAVQINSLGHPFNYEYHEVVEEKYQADVPAGEIIEVRQEGFLYKGEVLRMAKVVICSKKPSETSETQT